MIQNCGYLNPKSALYIQESIFTSLRLQADHFCVLVLQVSFLAEKTGEDSAKISAPFDVHGSEAYLLEDESLRNDSSIELEFSCDVILVRGHH